MRRVLLIPTVSVSIPLQITTSSLPSATAGVAYSTGLSGSGGKAPYTWSLLSASPNTGGWLSLSSAGVLSGTPSVSETESVIVMLADSSSPQQTATATLSLPIAAALQISTTSLPNASVGAAYSYQLTAIDGVLPYGWSLLSFSTYILAVSPSAVAASGYITPIVSPAVTVTPSGSLGPYIGAGAGGLVWTFPAGANGITASSPNSLTSEFSGSPAPGASISATALASVLDNYGRLITIGLPLSVQNTALFTGTMTAASGFGGSIGYSASAPYGSLSPAIDTNGNTVAAVFQTLAGQGSTTLQIASATSLGQGYFTNCVIGSTTLQSANAASYNYTSGLSIWSWTHGVGLSIGQQYPVIYA